MAKTERIQNMTKGSPAKLIFTFAIPLMLGNVFQQFYTVVRLLFAVFNYIVVGNINGRIICIAMQYIKFCMTNKIIEI